MRAVLAVPLACLVMPVFPTLSQTPAPEPTAEEQAQCRPDAIKFCFFKIGRAEALRQCLRNYREKLSAPCQGLMASRGN
jgi:hypothetical protein